MGKNSASCQLALRLIAFAAAGLTMTTPASPAPATRAAASKPRPKPDDFPIAPLVENYAPVVSPANIAPTPGTANDPKRKVEVFGEPRTVKGHPCTLWDRDDLARYKALLRTEKGFAKQLEVLEKTAERRIAMPLGVPGTHQGPDGKWLAPGDFPKDEPPSGNESSNSQVNAGAMSDLATVYALTDEEKYGEYCRKMLLAYAENYPKWGRPAGSTWRSARDLRFTYQFLNDGFVIAHMAWAYDLIHDLPSFTAGDRDKIDGFFRMVATPFFVQGAGRDYLSTKDNRSCICAAAVLMAGYATEDQDLIDFALHGHAGTKLRPMPTEAVQLNERELGARPGAPTPGGLMAVHFSEDCLLPDGLWVEGAPGYTLGIAGCGLFDAAETLWRHGVDMYRYRNGALKRLLDSGLLLANPDPKLTVPCLRDSGPFCLLDNRDWLNGQIGSIYNCGYQRYRDGRYVPIIANAAAHLGMTVHAGPPLVKENLDAVPAAPVVSQNVNFYSIGYGILRIADSRKTNSLLFQFSEEKDWAGHDHPSRLGVDLYTWGDTLAPFPGVIFPYNDPLDPKWYWTTMANCAMAVDQDDELDAGNRYHKYKGAPRPTAPQLVFAPAATLGMERAYSSSVYPGTTLDRALFMTADYVADLFGGFATVPRTYDLAWHFRAKVAAGLPLKAFEFPAPVPNGYNALDHVKHSRTDQAWFADVTFREKPLRFLAAAGEGTEVILGDGHFDSYTEHPPTILQRRARVNFTLYGNALDLSGENDPYVTSVTQEGSLDAGYGLLKLRTKRAGTDLCFAAYRPGTYQTSALETDAVQAMVVTDGRAIRAMYLGGGKMLKAGGSAANSPPHGATIERSEPGLAYVEKRADGTYVVGNPSPTEAMVTVTFPGLAKSFKAWLAAGGKAEWAAE